jgi:hypothetical protein
MSVIVTWKKNKMNMLLRDWKGSKSKLKELVITTIVWD